MFFSSRLQNIFDLICSQPYTTVKELTKQFKVTERTIRTDIHSLNIELKKYACEIKLKRKYGYYIEIYDRQLFDTLKLKNPDDDSLTLNSLNERIEYIVKQLLYTEDYLSIDELADSVFVSRNTMQNYIKNIKDLFEKYNLTYISKPNKGIKVFGNEKDKRECLVDVIFSKDTLSYVIGFSKKEQLLFSGIDLDLLANIISNDLEIYKIKCSDYDKKNLIMHFALMLSRVKSENYMPYDANFPLPDEVKEMINKMCKDIEAHFDVQITAGEKQYIYLHIATNATLQIGKVNPIILNQQIQNLLQIIYQEYNFDLRNDEILQKDLFNHFSSIFSNRDISIYRKNPLLNTIKSNFPLAFEITLTSTNRIFEKKLNEDEIGYVSLHIGAAIERCFFGQYDRKKVLLVCGSGIATTRMLEARLNTIFNSKIIIKDKISYAEFQTYPIDNYKEIDFVISTIPIHSDIVPIEIVDFALGNNDIEKISRRLSNMQKNGNKTQKFFDSKLFIHRKEVKDKAEIIEQLCRLLENQNIVDQNYFESVKTRESLAKTNMNNLFAIPHPMSPCSDQTKVAVAILDNPVLWNNDNESVQIIFMLSIRSGEQQDIEHLYDLFIDIVNDSKLQQDILHSETYENFIKVISKVSQ